MNVCHHRLLYIVYCAVFKQLTNVTQCLSAVLSVVSCAVQRDQFCLRGTVQPWQTRNIWPTWYSGS